jgi:hypothetical protein
MFAAELAKRVGSQKVVISHVRPSVVSTNMSDVLPFPLRQVVNGFKVLYGRSVEVGGRILVNALVVVGKESHWRYLKDKDVHE